MPDPIRLFAFCGSTRADSYNSRLLALACTRAEAKGAVTTTWDFRQNPFPLFDEDLESAEGIPEAVLEFKRQVRAADVILISSPEYNGSVSPLLKNAIDWASRPDPERMGNVWQGTVGGLLAASPGGLGGIRMLLHLRPLMSGVGMLVVPEQVALGGAYQAFLDDGTLRDERSARFLEGMVDHLLDLATRRR